MTFEFSADRPSRGLLMRGEGYLGVRMLRLTEVESAAICVPLQAYDYAGAKGFGSSDWARHRLVVRPCVFSFFMLRARCSSTVRSLIRAVRGNDLAGLARDHQ